MQQYFMDFKSTDKKVLITGDDYHHIKNVMRMKIGDELYLSNKQAIFFAVIQEITADAIVVEVFYEVKKQIELPHYISIAQGMPKASKFEMVVQKTTELGVSEIIPVLSERSVVKIDKKSAPKKLERFNKIAKSAAEQSHRLVIPEVKTFMSLNEFIQYSQSFDYKLVAYEASNESERLNFKNTLEKLNKDEKLLIFIGPEGGLSEQEITRLKEHDFQVISLGNRILRTETAPLFIMSAIGYELELRG